MAYVYFKTIFKKTRSCENNAETSHMTRIKL